MRAMSDPSRAFLFGPLGLRSGWRWLLHTVVFGLSLVLGLVAAVASMAVARQLGLPVGFETPWVPLVAYSLLTGPLFLVTALSGLFIDWKRPAAAGLGVQPAWTGGELIGGAVFGAAMLLPALGVMLAGSSAK